MKITTKSQSPRFQPYSVNILIESQFDEDILKHIANLNVTIPELVTKNWKGEVRSDHAINSTTATVLDNIRESIEERESNTKKA